MEWADPPKLPSLSLPKAPELPVPILEVPRADVPSYKSLVVPPNTLRPPPGIEGINSDPAPKESKSTPPKSQPVPPALPPVPPALPPEAQIIEIPFTDIEIPMPTTTIMTTAATTATISVAATLTATSIFKYLVTIMKPIIKQVWNKIAKTKKQDLLNSSYSSGQQDS